MFSLCSVNVQCGVFAILTLRLYAPQFAYEFNDTNGELEVFADADYAAGDQVFISYGILTNPDLMISYGFAMPDNMCVEEGRGGAGRGGEGRRRKERGKEREKERRKEPARMLFSCVLRAACCMRHKPVTLSLSLSFFFSFFPRYETIGFALGLDASDPQVCY